MAIPGNAKGYGNSSTARNVFRLTFSTALSAAPKYEAYNGGTFPDPGTGTSTTNVVLAGTSGNGSKSMVCLVDTSSGAPSSSWKPSSATGGSANPNRLSGQTSYVTATSTPGAGGSITWNEVLEIPSDVAITDDLSFALLVRYSYTGTAPALTWAFNDQIDGGTEATPVWTAILPGINGVKHTAAGVTGTPFLGRIPATGTQDTAMAWVIASYTTTFSLTETPVNENGAWSSNLGGDWTQVITASGNAVGTQSGIGGFDDSYARLNGAWSPDHEISGVIFKGITAGIMEVELLLRIIDSLHSVTLYECNLAHDGGYLNIYRWQGPKGTVVGDFIQLGAFSVPGGVSNGKIFKARIVGNVITVFYDGVQIGQVTDTAGAGGGAVLTSGRPGIGFYRESSGTASANFGFTSITATNYPP